VAAMWLATQLRARNGIATVDWVASFLRKDRQIRQSTVGGGHPMLRRDGGQKIRGRPLADSNRPIEARLLGH